MKRSLNNYLLLVGFLFSLFSTTAVSAQSSTSAGQTQELVFRNPVLVSGIDKTEGAVYKFGNIASGIDGYLTLKKFSNTPVTIKTIDNAVAGWDKAFQPEFGLAGNVTANKEWFIDFELTFYESGTTKKKKLEQFSLTSLDVDGDGGFIREYIKVKNAKKVTYSTVSQLNGTAAAKLCGKCSKSSSVIACSFCKGSGKNGSGSCSNCKGSGYVHNDCGHAYEGEIDNTTEAPLTNYNNIDTAATAVMVTYDFENKDAISFTIGAKSGSENRVSNAGVRLNSMWFKSFNLSPITTLPVKLTAFNAVGKNETALLDWTTAEEKDFSHFVIERSTDGKKYKDVAIVFSAGDSKENVTYSYKDKVGAATVAYYRLKMVDADGTVTYSNVRVVRTVQDEKSALKLTAYPNPAVHMSRLTFPAAWQGQTIKVEIYTQSGFLLRTEQFNGANQCEEVQLYGLQKGLYIIRATNGKEIAEQRIIKL